MEVWFGSFGVRTASARTPDRRPSKVVNVANCDCTEVRLNSLLNIKNIKNP